MKKLILSLIVISSLYISKSYAGTITVQSFTADSGVTHLNNMRTVVVDVINGNIAGGSGGTSSVNILADSVGEIEMANDANPRVRDSELLNITTDSFSSGSLTQNTHVESGGVPADSANLTSDISAVVAYINGYRVSVAATSRTYTVSVDTYVDLSQTGTYTFTEVAVGAAQPAVAANSARLARVTTDGTEITAVLTYPTGRIPGLLIPSHYRTGLRVSRDSASTINVGAGTCEINSTMVSKTANTVLNLATAGDWAGGTSLRAASTMGFVGLDASGNLRLHTTAPTHDNYGVSTNVGKRRYATWSSTVYRILGWFFMNGAQNVYESEIGNIKEADLDNSVMSNDTAFLSFSSTSFVDMNLINFYSSGGKITLVAVLSGDSSTALGSPENQFSRNGTAIEGSSVVDTLDDNGNPYTMNNMWFEAPAPLQGTLVYRSRLRMRDQTYSIGGRRMIIREE